MWLKWLPWKFIVGRLARSGGFADPIAILSHIRRFSQPSEVNEPIELLRAGVVFHARGLINSRVIQHNLDWVWPYWVNEQFDPSRETFVPRAISLTHVNLSGRNWTAVGLPGFSGFPIVDPRGAVMPFWDSWSIDAWIASDDNKLLAPSRLREVEQRLDFGDNLCVITQSEADGLTLQSRTWVDFIDGRHQCFIDLCGQTDCPGWLIVTLRPYNPEGVSFLHEIEFNSEQRAWRVNHKKHVFLSEPPDKHIVSDYRQGDVSLSIQNSGHDVHRVVCDVGMATAAAMYRIEPGRERQVRATVPLDEGEPSSRREHSGRNRWAEAMRGYCELRVPRNDFTFMYEAAVRSIVLLSPGEVYPGPFTYKRFWFRDAAFIIHAMLSTGMVERAEKRIDRFFPKQTALGYFHSQQGEWDSNGQVLWIMNRFCRCSGRAPKDQWIRPIIKAAHWIIQKRLPPKPASRHAGLLPVGFSAEHFGPSDYYYWDDFWSAAGLYAAAEMLEGTEQAPESSEFRRQADDLLAAIKASLNTCRKRLGRRAMPASPHRRLDSGAIGCLAACYPLALFGAEDDRVADTCEFLLDNCMVTGAFFHDISHSGMNPYLSLHLAQVLMRKGDLRFADLVKRVAELASPTGQWPEAINPRTGTGCMGDGQHTWASAEWIMMMTNALVLEQGERLIIGAGVFPEWLDSERPISTGPVYTIWGPLRLHITASPLEVAVEWEGRWYSKVPEIEVRIPTLRPVKSQQGGRDETSRRTNIKIRRKKQI
jgi:hypothetical protein